MPRSARVTTLFLTILLAFALGAGEAVAKAKPSSKAKATRVDKAPRQSGGKSAKSTAKKSTAKKSTAKKSTAKKSSKKKASQQAKNARGKRSRAEKVTYKVKSGDTLGKIARKFNTDVKTLRKLNRLKGTQIRTGKPLVVRLVKAGKGPSRLQDGVQLPESGPGYMAPRRDRVWGTRGTIEHIQEAAATVARQYPGTVPLFIGDVSFARGGFMPPHKSHRGGNDVDISYFKKDNDPGTHFESVSAKTMDAEKNWAFIAALLDSGHVTAIYIDRRLHKPLRDAAAKMGYDEETLTRLFETRGYDKGASRTAVIRHIRGHGDHMHVRFDCPKGDHPSS